MKTENANTLSRFNTKQMTAIAMMTALCCILGPLTVPIGPVPISLTVVSVYLSVFALGMKNGTIAYCLYLLLAFTGLPVLSGFTGGPGRLLGPTGGYLFGFILMGLISGFFIDRFTGKRRILFQAAGMLLGLIVCYFFGTVWFLFLMNHGGGKMTVQAALGLCVYPFIPFDLLKIAACIVIGNALRTGLRRANF